MENSSGVFQQALKKIGRRDVTLDDPHARIGQGTLDVRQPATDEVINHDDLSNGFREQLVDDVGADETGTANHDDLLISQVHGSLDGSTGDDSGEVKRRSSIGSIGSIGSGACQLDWGRTYPCSASQG